MRQIRWRAVTLAVFAWFFVVRGESGSSSDESDTPFTMVGPFAVESQCKRIRDEIAARIQNGATPENPVYAGAPYISECWEGPTS